MKVNNFFKKISNKVMNRNTNNFSLDIDRKYNEYVHKFEVEDRINKVLSLTNQDEKLSEINNQEIKTERSFPGDKLYLESGYYKKMIFRYLFAMSFTNNKIILDGCCGLGWGSYIISANAKKVYSIDKDDISIDFCRNFWQNEKIEWITGSVLNLKFSEGFFDTVLAMETIEHFDKDNGEKYISEIGRVLKKDGYIIGSSFFPKKVKDAKLLCSTNSYHKHIYTQKEMAELLSKYFTEYNIIDNWLFWATNKNVKN